MKIAFFSAKKYDHRFFDEANKKYGHDITYFDVQLNSKTALLAKGYQVICAFVNDDLSEEVIRIIASQKTCLIALRSAGFNNVDLEAAKANGINIIRVPEYSPYAVAEFAIGLMLALNRKIYRAWGRVREGNFSLDGLLGFDMNGKTVGIVGTGKIGLVVTRILFGFGCKLLGYDKFPNPECTRYGMEYTSFEDLLSRSDIVTLHAPLTPETKHMINEKAFSTAKDKFMLINTSRGELIDTKSAIEALKSGKLGCLGIDVYEEETNIFFENLSDEVIQDDVLARLMTFPNVVITSHQGFFTKDALQNIADTTLKNITDFETHGACSSGLSIDEMVRKEMVVK